MRGFSYVVLGIGGAICALNFYLSFLRYSVHALLRKRDQVRSISGFPFVGSGLVVLSLVLGQLASRAVLLGVTVAALDTGGIQWFAGAMAWERIRKRS